MFGLNGNRQQVSDLIFGFIDSFLVLAAIFLSVFLRCHNNSDADYFLGGKLAVLTDVPVEEDL